MHVLLIDDEWLVRAGLTTMLSGAEGITVVGEAGDGAGVVELVRSTRPDVVLMDLRMPGTDGITATAQLRDLPPAVLVLTTFDTDELVRRALRAGADGFLLKDTPPADLVAAIRRAARGEPTFSPGILRKLMAQIADGDEGRRARARSALATLTQSERRVAEAVGEGLSNAEIAASQFMSVTTIKSYVSRVLVKLEVANRVQIALLVHDAK
ncbi:response regulator transcription factor [Allokutzneria oryzae]|uniref:Response regulator n=1 Tax=Allokutzneria oryzae TaxID=1378989 RepID=A0ABV6A3P9_9PSEU